MLNRRLASLLAAVSVAGLVAAGCAEQSAAIRVDDATVSRSDFEDQLDLVYDNEAFRSVLFGGVTRDQLRGEDDPPGTYRQEFVSAMASVQVQLMVIPGLLEELDLEVDEGERQAVIDDIAGELPGAFDDLPDGVRDRYVDGIAGLNVLQSELGADFQATFMDAMGAADVHVDSRYGSWDADQTAVVPPPGPAAAPGSSGAGAVDLPAG